MVLRTISFLKDYMNSSVYIWGKLRNGYTQYPDNYAQEIYENFVIKSSSKSQIVIHRNQNMMYYGYVRKLDAYSQNIGFCVLLNGVMFSKIGPLFTMFEKAFAELVSQAEIIRMDDSGNMVAAISQLTDKQQEVERILAYLKGETERLEHSASKLPPVNYSKANDSTTTFSASDKEEEIVAASAIYGYTCITKNEGFDTPLLAGLRSVLQRKAGIAVSPTSASTTQMVGNIPDGEKRGGQRRLKVFLGILVLGLIGIISSVIVLRNNSTEATETESPLSEVMNDDTVESSMPMDNMELMLKGYIINIGFSMKLHVSGGVVEGTEHYDSQPDDKLVQISGYIDDNGTIELYEYDKGQETGHFSGVLSDNTYSGTWSSPSGKNLAFYAKVMPMEEYETDQKRPYSTYRPRFEKSTSEVDVVVEFDFPSSGPTLLVENIRGYIAEVLSKYFWWSDNREKPKYNGDLTDGQALANYIGQFKVNILTQEHQEEGGSYTYNEDISIDKIYENNDYITYVTTLGGCHGGVGWSEIFGQTFRKSDGRKIKVIKNSNNASFKQLLIQSVLEQVEDADGLNADFIQSPVPQTEPYLVNGGVKFIYQKYEIGPGYMGCPEVVIYKNEILPYLTDEAKKLLE